MGQKQQDKCLLKLFLSYSVNVTAKFVPCSQNTALCVEVMLQKHQKIKTMTVTVNSGQTAIFLSDPAGK
jgi:hypothetical protein